MVAAIGTADRPLRVAIVGAGPAAFYTADALIRQRDLVCAIDIFNRFPTPYGLVRDGVAPDHQSIKAVTRVFDRIAGNAGIRYFGNVTFGTDLLHEDLKHWYDQVVYAVGAQADRRMGIPGEDLAGSLPATAFVGWYNGHPDYRALDPDLHSDRVVVVGNGNVAIDVARILVKSPDALARTDIANHALEKLRQSSVREVILLGRRGPAQAAFTHAELKELGTLNDVDVIVDPADLVLDSHSASAVADDAMAAKNLDLLRTYASRPPTGAPRRIYIRFLLSPAEIVGEQGRVSAVRVQHNQLVLGANGGLRAQGTGAYETITCGLVLRSVGYRSVPLSGVPFDESTLTIMNIAGRVAHPSTGEPIVGEYVVGWAKRGPNGVIGTNKPDAVSTVASMMEDLASLPAIPDSRRDVSHIDALLAERKPDYVSYQDWLVLDQYERDLGAAESRPRVKVCSVSEMLEVIRAGTPA